MKNNRYQRLRAVFAGCGLKVRAFTMFLLICSSAIAQSRSRPDLLVQGSILDTMGNNVPSATIAITGAGFHRILHADRYGRFSLHVSSADPLTVTATAQGMISALITLDPALHPGSFAITLHPSALQQQMVVTATRDSSAFGASVRNVSSLTALDLRQYPALTLDDRLRQHAGFELFRRSSGWVANPTSEGVSLRGLGSTAASRTLVLSDGVPLNDPFGGWLHWNELPPAAVESVELASGGGSDLYGSSALGGVIDIVPARPGPLLASADLSEAGENTTPLSGRVDAKKYGWDALLAGESFRTAGYTLIAPQVRGPVDRPANVNFQNGRIEVDRAVHAEGRAFLVANLLNEARNNGTALQTNGTRLWRYITGDDWSAGTRISGRVRAFGSNEAYRQTFSAINAARSSEKLTRAQRVTTQEFGASADASLHLSQLAFVAGADLRDLRATDVEAPYANRQPSGLQDTSARQRFLGGFGEVLLQQGRWSAAASLRADEAVNLDSRTFARTAGQPATSKSIPYRKELIFSPRVGLSRQLGTGFALRASGFRAFRAPTLNELYRTGQVGQQITLPNAELRSERATGVEAGASWNSPGRALKVDGTYFWTAINRPVSTVLLRKTATSITNQRDNLGQIQSQGVDLEAHIQPLPVLEFDLGYQYAHAVVTAFPAQPELIGLWIPQVPRHTATAQLRWRPERNTTVLLSGRASGRAFDDSSNQFELHSFFVLGLYAERSFGQHLSAYLSLQNLLNRSVEVARTPNLTLGTPFVPQGGLRLNWGGS